MQSTRTRTVVVIAAAVLIAAVAIGLVSLAGSLGGDDSSGGTPKQAAAPPASGHEVPASTPESKAMAKELKRRGFRFVGPTVCYAFMQAVGMVDDHTVDCFRCQPASPHQRRS